MEFAGIEVSTTSTDPELFGALTQSQSLIESINRCRKGGGAMTFLAGCLMTLGVLAFALEIKVVLAGRVPQITLEAVYIALFTMAPVGLVVANWYRRQMIADIAALLRFRSEFDECRQLVDDYCCKHRRFQGIIIDNIWNVRTLNESREKEPRDDA